MLTQHQSAEPYFRKNVFMKIFKNIFSMFKNFVKILWKLEEIHENLGSASQHNI